jgi:hypothetical protein
MSRSNKTINSSILRNERGATAVKSQFKDNTDPAYVGPGIWFRLHSKSFQANTSNLQIEMIKDIRDTCNNFPCHVCREHAQKYIKDHPPEEYLDVHVDGMNIGIFVWMWIFHNSVNARINKPIMSWDTAFDLYNITEEKKGMCSKSCMNAAGGENVGGIKIPEVNKGNVKNFTLMKDLYK